MVQKKYMSMTLYAAVGIMGGLMHDVAPRREDIWSFSPFVDLNLYRFFRQVLRLNRNAIQRRVIELAAFNIACNALVLGAELLRWGGYDQFKKAHGTFFLFEDSSHSVAIFLWSAATTL